MTVINALPAVLQDHIATGILNQAVYIADVSGKTPGDLKSKRTLGGVDENSFTLKGAELLLSNSMI